MGARTKNLHRASLVAFCNWCVATARLTSNPFRAVKKANEDVDRRRERRAFTETELIQLFDAAQRRPLLDRMTVRRGSRKGETYARLRPETRVKLDRQGRERALIYKALALTGLRKGELDLPTIGQVHLEAKSPYLKLNAADEKNREPDRSRQGMFLLDPLKPFVRGDMRLIHAPFLRDFGALIALAK